MVLKEYDWYGAYDNKQLVDDPYIASLNLDYTFSYPMIENNVSNFFIYFVKQNSG